MTPTQRRVTLAICISVGLTFLISAGLAYLVEPMSTDLGLMSNQVQVVLAVPSVASLVVIFIAGQMGDRLGHRRTLLGLSAVFILGSILIAVAPGALVVVAGLALCGAAATAIQIVALGLLQQTVPEGRPHVSAFTTFGMVYPLAFLVFPVMTAGLLEVTQWRLIPVIWAAAGVLIAIVVARSVDHPAERHPMRDWLTPLLAGMVLAGAVRFLDAIGRQGLLNPVTLLGFAVFLLELIAFIIRFRMATNPGFSFAPIRGMTVRVLLLGVALVALVGTLTYVILAFQYLYGMTPLQASIAVIPAQAGAVVGAKLIAGRTIRRWGIARAGRWLTLALAISMLPLIAMQASTPPWYLMATATLFSTLAMASVTVFNTDVMARAAIGNTGSMSSFRGAASSIGSGLAVLVLGTSVMTAVDMSAGSANVSAQQAEQLAAGLRIDGVLGCAVALIAWATLQLVERRAKNAEPHDTVSPGTS